jgi:hypothetical protein
LYTEDFIQWFDDHIGNDICDSAKHEDKKNKNKLYDVIILDLLDAEDLPEGEEWAEHLYSKLFFERIACALQDNGVIVTNFGEAPENPYYDKEALEMMSKKIEQIQTMSSYFRHTRVYETPVPAFRADWAFAISMVPDRSFLKTNNNDDDMSSEAEEAQGATSGTSNIMGMGGIYDFEANEVRVNLKLRRGLHKNTYPLEYYDGAIQHTFQYPTGGWEGVYCMNPANKEICNIDIILNKAYDDHYFEVDTETLGIVAKQDIKKGHVSALYYAVSSLELPPSTNLSNTTTSTTFAANTPKKNNVQGIYDALPWTRELFDRWNPVSALSMKELDHVVVATRDIPKGELIVDDFARWNAFSFGKDERLAMIKKWIG